MNFNDSHLRVFFMSVFIFVLSFCGIYYLSSVIYPETFKGGEGYIGTFISLATYKEGEEKILVDACYVGTCIVSPVNEPKKKHCFRVQKVTSAAAESDR